MNLHILQPLNMHETGLKKHLQTDSKILGVKNDDSKQSETLLEPENAESKKKCLLKSTMF